MRLVAHQLVEGYRAPSEWALARHTERATSPLRHEGCLSQQLHACPRPGLMLALETNKCVGGIPYKSMRAVLSADLACIRCVRACSLDGSHTLMAYRLTIKCSRSSPVE